MAEGGAAGVGARLEVVDPSPLGVPVGSHYPASTPFLKIPTHMPRKDQRYCQAAGHLLIFCYCFSAFDFDRNIGDVIPITECLAICEMSSLFNSPDSDYLYIFPYYHFPLHVTLWISPFVVLGCSHCME